MKTIPVTRGGPHIPTTAPTPAPAPWWTSPDGAFALHEGDCRDLLPRLTSLGHRPALIFADPPYHLSNDGITCRSGQMVSVNKGDWDRSEGAREDHEFVLSWLAPSLDSLAPGGTIWISGTQHIIFSVGFGLQELGAKILNTIVWEKPAPPPNLSCRYYTHSHELLLWARRPGKEKHTFHYAFEKSANGGKQQKDVWTPRYAEEPGEEPGEEQIPNHWRINRPLKTETALGKHPTQKPIELLDRIIRCSTNEGDLVIDPFCGSGTTGLAALALGRRFIGIDASVPYLTLARDRARQFHPTKP